jgi:hypothetical protein
MKVRVLECFAVGGWGHLWGWCRGLGLGSLVVEMNVLGFVLCGLFGK